MESRPIWVAVLVVLLGLAGCAAERSSHGDRGISPPGGWKERGPLEDPNRHLQFNLCEWYHVGDQRGLFNVAIHLTNLSRHDVGGISVSFRIYGDEGGKKQVLRLDDYLPAYASLYTHVALDGTSRVYPNISGRILGARILDTPGK